MKIYSTEEEQLEALGVWWHAWRLPLFAGLSALAIGAGGYALWQDNRAGELERLYRGHEDVVHASNEVRAGLVARNEADEQKRLDDEAEPTDVEALPASGEPVATMEELQQQFDQLMEMTQALMASAPKSGYSWLSAINVAALAAQMERRPQAIILLRQTVHASASFWRGNKMLHSFFRLYLARLLGAEQMWQEALDVLDEKPLDGWMAQADDLRGDLLAAQGDIDGARVAWEQARALGTDDFLDALLGIKLNSWHLLTAIAELPATQESTP